MLSVLLIFCLLQPVLAMAERRVALVPAAEDCRRRHKLNNRLADALAA